MFQSQIEKSFAADLLSNWKKRHGGGLRIGFLLIMVAMAVTSPGCRRAQTDVSGSRAEVAYIPQVRSLSVSGPMRASVVVGLAGNARELRLTNDGGQTWQIITPPATGSAFECATTTGSGRGWAINREGQVFGSTGAGTIWTKIDANASSSPEESLNSANRIEFVSDTIGWVQTALAILRTEDGGVTWHQKLSVTTTGVSGQPTTTHPLDANTLVGAGTKGQIYITRDGGEHWRIQTLMPTGDFEDISFATPQNGWITGYVAGHSSKALLFVTKDGGEQWEELEINEEVRPWSISFVNDRIGWLAGHQYLDRTTPPFPMENLLLQTTDGGKHWTRMKVNSDDPFFSLVRFTDEQHGWLAGRDNLYRTEDGGATWTKILSVQPAR
jgi:photosystem II stability/assembly factor-like uncharacterized protein